jgi:methionyl-tRNA formyltransferase
LRAAADEAGVTAFETAKLGEPGAIAKLRTLAPELTVMAFVSDMIPQEVLDLPKHGAIQYHPSLLPLHRGRSAINWAIAMGDAKTGVSIFWPDAGWDTGPILLQREVEIGPDDTTGSLYYDKLYQLGIDMMLESVRLVAAGKAPKVVQDESKATFEKGFSERDGRVDWTKAGLDVYRLVRAADPSPGAWTRHNGTKLRLLDGRYDAGAIGAPGTVLAIDESGVLVAAGSGGVRLRKLLSEGSPAGPAADIAKAIGLKVGDRLSAT